MATKSKSVKSKSFLSQIKWGESYTSLFLGAVVVLIGLILIFSFIRARNSMNKFASSISTTLEKQVLPSTYTVKEGDDLWSISKKVYGTGYNWVSLVKANNIKNPNVVYVGTKLNIPDVKPIVVQEIQNVREKTISGASYSVVKGDCLWNIAVRAYGDGYKWPEIAKANKLVNPNLIHPGNEFILPR